MADKELSRDSLLTPPPPQIVNSESNVHRCLAGFFRTNDRCRTFYQWLQLTPERCEQRGKLQATDGGDCICSALATNALSSHGKRDMSFIKYKYDEDENLRNDKEVKMIKVFGYGRLDFIVALTLPAAPEFGVDKPQFHILAHITKPRMLAEMPRPNGFCTRNLDNHSSLI
ncbi:hypothetical protein RhiJN_16095 [Ceratobasidium sp. AG-Ba]|nr:hypothetical protein RhiJN_16095 [Ceratobasidium sp. AG-Ba]